MSGLLFANGSSALRVFQTRCSTTHNLYRRELWPRSEGCERLTWERSASSEWCQRPRCTQCGSQRCQTSTSPPARDPFPSCPDSKPYTTPLPVALIRGPAHGLTPSTREGSATRACGLFGFACAVIAALGRTHRAPVARGWSPPPRQEPERCRKPFRSLTPVAGISPSR